MVTASLQKQLSLLAVKRPKRQGACMPFLQASWATLHVFYPMKICYSCKWNNQDRPDLIVVKHEVSLSTRKHCGKCFFGPFYHSLKDSNVCGYRFYQWEPEAFRLREDPSLVLGAIYFKVIG